MGEFYKLTFDMELVDRALAEKRPYIYAEQCNAGEIETEKIKKGRLNTVFMWENIDFPWPEVTFYYSSRASDRECDYLVNIKRWPLVHRRVMDAFVRAGISGLRYYPVKLVDVCTEKVNDNYYMMYVENFIDAYDMQRSKYYHYKDDKIGISAYTFVPMQCFLNRDNCEGYDVFRPDKSHASIFVSEKVKDIIETNGFEGFDLTRQD